MNVNHDRIFIFGGTIPVKVQMLLINNMLYSIMKYFSPAAPLIWMACTSRRSWARSSSPRSCWWIQSKDECSELQGETCKSMRCLQFRHSAQCNLTDSNPPVYNQWSCVNTVLICFSISESLCLLIMRCLFEQVLFAAWNNDRQER